MPGPGFLCIGAQKSGTTWLYENLSKHQGAWVTPVKELHYFNRVCMNSKLLGYWDMPHPQGMERYSGMLFPPRLNDLRWAKYYYNYGLSKDWYLRLFDEEYTGKKVCGDITPDYSTLEEGGVRYVQEVVGKETPVIFIVRSPVERSWSAAKMILRYRGLELKDENFGVLEDLLSHPVISVYGQYSKTIKLWRSHFTNFHVLSYEELCQDPVNFLSKVADIINLDNQWDPKTVERLVWADKQNLPIPPKFRAILDRELEAESIATKALVDCDFINRW